LIIIIEMNGLALIMTGIIFAIISEKLKPNKVYGAMLGNDIDIVYNEITGNLTMTKRAYKLSQIISIWLIVLGTGRMIIYQ
jgi:hypothetical protein